MYGLPKIHKDGASIRPIISAVNTYNYELAKYLNEILKPLVNNEFTINDTYEFVNKANTLNVHVNKYMVSFDVESLFTNVPTLETIDLILGIFADDEPSPNGLLREFGFLWVIWRRCSSSALKNRTFSSMGSSTA